MMIHHCYQGNNVRAKRTEVAANFNENTKVQNPWRMYGLASDGIMTNS